jgi:hypothetical protein
MINDIYKQKRLLANRPIITRLLGCFKRLHVNFMELVKKNCIQIIRLSLYIFLSIPKSSLSLKIIEYRC